MTQQPQYGQYGQPFQSPHAQATTVLILGVVGLVACQLLSPFAWSMGNKTLREIDASGGQLGGRSEANAGRILGIIGTCLLGFTLVVFLGIALLALVGFFSATTVQ